MVFVRRRGIRAKEASCDEVKIYRRQAAYEDHPLPIGLKQTISQPYIVAYMTQSLQLQKSDRVLEIGTGSGYQAAVLGELAQEVYTIEIIPQLGERSKKLLADLGYRNIHVRVGDGYQGWPDKAPFDAIIVTAAPPKLPQPLLDQLKIGGAHDHPGRQYQTRAGVHSPHGKRLRPQKRVARGFRSHDRRSSAEPPPKNSK